MERPALRPGSRSRRRATADRTPGALEVHVIHQPAATPRPDDVDGQNLIAIRALQLYAIRPELVVTWHEHGAFDDPVARMIEVFLNHGEALAQHVRVHRLRRGAALGAPQLAHPFQIVRFDCREKLRDRLIRRFGGRLFRRSPLATSCQRGEQDELNYKTSLHGVRPVVGTTRR